MFKKLILPLALITATSLNAQTFEIDTEACAGVEHIRDLTNTVVPYDPAIHTFVTEDTPVFYAGREQIPHIEVGIVRNATIFVTNTTSSVVSFFFNPTFHSLFTGTELPITPPTLFGTFNSSNSPLDGAGSNMPPNSSGAINYPVNSASHFFGNAEILWDSSTCFETLPLLTTVKLSRDHPNNSFATSYYFVNDGRNW